MWGRPVSQQRIRSLLGGDPDKTPLGDRDVWNAFTNETGVRHVMQPGGISPTRAVRALDVGYNLSMNLKDQPGVGHAVTINRITKRIITKNSGKQITKYLIDVMNPAKGQYVRISNYKLTNAHSFFLIFP